MNSPFSLHGRRRFLGLAAASGLLTAGRWDSRALGDKEPKRDRDPRAISGDTNEPKWDQGLMVTVGPKDAEIIGTSDKAIQAAVDYVHRLGEGTVKILPGTYRLRNSIFLPSKIRLLGSGPDTILIKEPSITTKIDANSDWYDRQIVLTNPKGFAIGDGVCLRAKDTHSGASIVMKRTLVGQSGNRFRLDRPLRENLWIPGSPTASTLFPLLTGEFVSDIVIENLALDGNKSQNENLDGNYSGCIFFQDCQRIRIQNVIARNQNGDGISWQICHDVSVENSHSHDNVGLGLHPGSGSQRPIMKNNKIENNNIGVFFCWGVRFGLAENNKIINNDYGVSIGHRDTDNVVRNNDILKSTKVGVLFRDEIRAFAAHRNRIENNRIIDSGPETAAAVDVSGETESIVIVGNTIRETRAPMKRIGVRIGKKTKDVQLAQNQIEGFFQEVAS